MKINSPFLFLLFLFFLPITAYAAMPSLNFTINMSETVFVNTTGGTPTIALTIDDKPRVASYVTGTGTNALTFTYTPTVGDVDLDGITFTSPYNIILNSGTIKDTAGNAASLSFTPAVTTGVKVNYPSLSMDFVTDADGRYTLNGNPHDTLSAFLTDAGGSFSRSSIGTYFDSTGTLQTAAANTPRFDYDPVTHTAKGILIEEQRTNNVLSSGNILSGFTLNSTLAGTNTTAAPDGITSVTSIKTDTLTTLHYIGRNISVTTGTTYTTSIFAKAGTTSSLQIAFGASSFSDTQYVNFNLASGTIGTASGLVGYGIENTGNGWYRCWASQTAIASNSSNSFLLSVTENNTSASRVPTYTGTEKDIFLWGAQFETGSFPTSYIPTTTASVTRVADNLTIPTEGWFLSSEGTYFSQWNKYGGNNTRILSFDNPTDTPIAHNASNQFQLFGAINITTGTAPLNSINKGGSTYKTSVGTSLSGNGSAAATNASLLATPTLLRVAPASGTNYFNGWIQKVKYYPLRASDTQLQLMTQ